MKGLAIDIHTTAEVVEAAAAVARPLPRERLSAYFELTKPRITLFIALTSAAGFSLGSAPGALDYARLFHTLLAVSLLSSGIATLNQYMERDLDRLMRRTASRPLPSGRLEPAQALLFGVALTVAAEVYLALFVNQLSAVVGLAVARATALLPPLKTKTTLSTFVGPPRRGPALIGWTAATAASTSKPGALRHLFLCSSALLRHRLDVQEDYARAGVRMLPVSSRRGA